MLLPSLPVLLLTTSFGCWEGSAAPDKAHHVCRFVPDKWHIMRLVCYSVLRYSKCIADASHSTGNKGLVAFRLPHFLPLGFLLSTLETVTLQADSHYRRNLLQAATPAGTANTTNPLADQYFMSVAPDGNFALGCQKFFVAGWNECALPLFTTFDTLVPCFPNSYLCCICLL